MIGEFFNKKVQPTIEGSQLDISGNNGNTVLNLKDILSNFRNILAFQLPAIHFKVWANVVRQRKE